MSKITEREGKLISPATLVFGAAGVAAGVGASSAQASIIYTPLSSPVNAATPTVNLDLDHDGVVDDSIDYSTSGLMLNKQATKTSYIAGADNTSAAALPFGETIGPTAPTGDAYVKLTTVPTTTSALLKNADDSATPAGYFTTAAGEKYIGVRLDINSSSYFGWIGFETTNQSTSAALAGQVDGYALESSAGVAITAGAVPEPSSLTLLALGASGLTLYRRRRPR